MVKASCGSNPLPNDQGSKHDHTSEDKTTTGRRPTRYLPKYTVLLKTPPGESYTIYSNQGVLTYTPACASQCSTYLPVVCMMRDTFKVYATRTNVSERGDNDVQTPPKYTYL